MKTGILSLGYRTDASAWQNGCKGLGFDVPNPIKKGNPSIDELKEYFARKVDWLFIGGHSNRTSIGNEAWKDNIRALSVSITFEEKRVVLCNGNESVLLNKGTAGFCLDSSARLVLFGGCSMLADRMVIRIFRELFNNCVLIGFKEMTGEKIINAILGAGFIEDHFFLRVSGHVDEPDIIGRIWLETAAAKNAYAGTTNENRFAFVDSKGRRWIIKDGKVKSDIRV